ncbi:MAG: sarcosine oxidase subunit delta [Chloroflexi bacterium]|nr:sarcosine oxidase subunit delta [Chloroflexota bacterium]
MLRITCPNCGRRPVEEYRFGGELRGAAASITDPAQRDVDYVWMRDNIEGVTTERWFHSAGCRRWLTLSRDTITDTVVT